MRYVLLFLLIQLINIPLTILGWLTCLSPTMAYCLWLWWNDEDGSGPGTTWWSKYVWLAWRNPVANLKHVPGVSGVGRPLWYWSNQKFYAKAGWLSNGYPCLSFGSGRGY